jgi:hypothetical protein
MLKQEIIIDKNGYYYRIVVEYQQVISKFFLFYSYSNSSKLHLYAIYDNVSGFTQRGFTVEFKPEILNSIASRLDGVRL